MGMIIKSRPYFGVLLSIIFVFTSSPVFCSPGAALLLYKAIEVGDLEKTKVLLVGADVNI